MYTEDDLLPLSGLQHLLFCERRAALVHLEQAWDENRYTIEGRISHERVHEAGGESRNQVRIARGVHLRSLRLGLAGIADVVEYHRVEAPAGTTLPTAPGRWQPLPVEYKRGRLRAEEGYAVQLCAQALCLEEMLDVEIPAGALFYGASRRRLVVAFDQALRGRTEEAAARLHQLIAGGTTPVVRYEKKCDRCSLYDLCRPKTTGRKLSVRGYLDEMLEV